MDKRNNKGYFDKCLALDLETTGMNFGDIPSKDYSIVSAGLIVADANTFKPIEELYVEIQWNGKSLWNDKAEAVHGLSRDYLKKNGISEVDAAEQIGGLLYEHFGIDDPICLLGHNVASFDIHFLKKFLTSHELPFKFAHRTLDTFGLGYALFNTYNSTDLFAAMGLPVRDKHNALDDARYALETYRRIKMIWNKKVMGE